MSIAHRVRPFVLALAIPAAALTSAALTSAALTSAAGGHAGSPGFGGPAVSARTAFADYSPNWGGYVASGTKFRYVQATFKVPKLNCAKTPGTTKNPDLVGEWVGLDTVTVEQDGISGQCANGHEEYAAWYEMFPKGPVYPGLTVHQGNTIQVSVWYVASKHEYRLILDNLTNGQGFTKWERCGGRSCANSSAEVITESPGKSVAAKTAYYPLADFGTTSFSGISVTDAAVQRGTFTSGYWRVTRFVMDDSADRVKAAISGLTGSGSAFQTYWEHAS